MPIRRFMFVRDLPWPGDATVPRPSRSHDFPRLPLPKFAILKGELCGPIEGQGIVRQLTWRVGNFSARSVSGRSAGGRLRLAVRAGRSLERRSLSSAERRA